MNLVLLRMWRCKSLVSLEVIFWYVSLLPGASILLFSNLNPLQGTQSGQAAVADGLMAWRPQHPLFIAWLLTFFVHMWNVSWYQIQDLKLTYSGKAENMIVSPIFPEQLYFAIADFPIVQSVAIVLVYTQFFLGKEPGYISRIKNLSETRRSSQMATTQAEAFQLHLKQIDNERLPWLAPCLIAVPLSLLPLRKSSHWLEHWSPCLSQNAIQNPHGVFVHLPISSKAASRHQGKLPR